ncbi:hypothetical protein LINPERPRIM_LOCUS40846, partial [Linum perenne]
HIHSLLDYQLWLSCPKKKKKKKTLVDHFPLLALSLLFFLSLQSPISRKWIIIILGTLEFTALGLQHYHFDYNGGFFT